MKKYLPDIRFYYVISKLISAILYPTALYHICRDLFNISDPLLGLTLPIGLLLVCVDFAIALNLPCEYSKEEDK